MEDGALGYISSPKWVTDHVWLSSLSSSQTPQTSPHHNHGHDNHYRGAWVEKMMQVESKDRSQALTVINSNITAAFNLSSISLVLSSLIGAWIGTSSNTTFTSKLIYGNTSPSVVAIKHISLLICFLVAFASFVQSARCYVHSNFLITMPDTDIPMTLVQKAVVSGSNFWLVGMRAFYFATPLLLWVFGPIPMFVSSVDMVVVSYNLDWNSTPLLPFPPAEGRGREILKNISQEITAVIEHHGRPWGRTMGQRLQPQEQRVPTYTFCIARLKTAESKMTCCRFCL